MSKLSYLMKSAIRSFDSNLLICQNCHSRQSEIVCRKYYFTALRRCAHCKILFRTPVDPPEEAEEFYQSDYTQGMTTEVPDAAGIERLKATNFSGTDRDFSHYLGLLRALGATTGRLFDFGSSWGYGSYQLQKAGFAVESYEISHPRRRYGEDNLGVVSHTEFPGSATGFDVFFSAHVLEHVPSPSSVITEAMKMVRPGGLIVSITPNGSDAFRSRYPAQWKALWGQVHPNFLDDVYYRANFSTYPMLLTSVKGRGPLPDDKIGLLASFAGRQGVTEAGADEYELISVIRSPS